jgi:uncharacterized protein (TIGR02217 family)
MPFHEIRFPTGVSLGASGGPERKTEIVALASGHEERNSPWAQSRRRYNAGYGVRSLDDIHDVIAFFEARRGRLHGFRWKDASDWKSCAPLGVPAATDQIIGAGDGVTAVFELVKTYQSGGESYARAIRKPVSGSVIVAIDGAPQIEGTDFTVDATTGLVTFETGSIPAGETEVTAGFAFDVPVRFDTDRLDINLAAFHAGEIPDIPIVEIRL